MSEPVSPDPMPEWAHTHDLQWRGRSFPVMRFRSEGGHLEVYFRADGIVEWVSCADHFMFRGTLTHGASLERISRCQAVGSPGELPS